MACERYTSEITLENDNYKVLKDFLLNIECLDPLSEWTSKFNLFEILKISTMEIWHSKMLAWLMNPNENHGLGDHIIRGFIQYGITSFGEGLDVFDALLMDCYDFVVQTEWRNIDLVAVSVDEKFVLCIENKIGSGEHDDQLNRYRKIIKDTYPKYKHMYIYLSPDGTESSEPEYWCSMGYQDVLNIVENARRKVKLLPDAELLIDNYVEVIRRVIVGDERLVEICAEIYSKHQKALDLIFENKPDRASDVATIFKSWAKEMTEKGELEVVLDKCNKSYTRFKTKVMSEVLPDTHEPSSGWNTKNYYFYEIRNIYGEKFLIQLSLSSKSIPEKLLNICNKINEDFPSRQQKENWQWRTPFTSRRSKINEEISEEKIYEELNKMWEEVKDFEEKLMSFLGK